MCVDCRGNTEPVKEAAAKIGHVPAYSGKGKVTDSYDCSCGWKSKEHWGDNLALDEWVNHAQTIIRRES